MKARTLLSRVVVKHESERLAWFIIHALHVCDALVFVVTLGRWQMPSVVVEFLCSDLFERLERGCGK